MPGVPDSTLPGVSSQHHPACPFAPVISCRSSSAIPPAPSGRRSYAQGRWSVARAPATGWTDCDRGPEADAEERITSAHRAIEIREKRRRVLLSRPAPNRLKMGRPQLPVPSPVARQLDQFDHYQDGEPFDQQADDNGDPMPPRSTRPQAARPRQQPVRVAPYPEDPEEPSRCHTHRAWLGALRAGSVPLTGGQRAGHLAGAAGRRGVDDAHPPHV